MKDITIEVSKKKLFLLLTGSLSFVLVSLLFVLSPDKYTSFLIRNEKIIELIGYVGVIFFGIATFFIFIKFLDKKPGLIINEKGIFDNSNAGSLGLIEWNDIIDIRQEKVMSTKFLLIMVKNPERYIEKASGLKKVTLKQNMITYKTPLTLTSAGLKSTFEDLRKVIFDSWEKYKQR